MLTVGRPGERNAGRGVMGAEVDRAGAGPIVVLTAWSGGRAETWSHPTVNRR